MTQFQNKVILENISKNLDLYKKISEIKITIFFIFPQLTLLSLNYFQLNGTGLFKACYPIN